MRKVRESTFITAVVFNAVVLAFNPTVTNALLASIAAGVWWLVDHNKPRSQ